MSSRFRTPIVAMALALVVVIFDVAAGQEGMRRDARETAPEALIGTWELNVARSTYTGGARPPQSQVRNFDYTYDAMILCHGVTVNANGNRSEFHWRSRSTAQITRNMREARARPCPTSWA